MKPYTQYFLIVLFFFPLWISAQVFPVQANPQVIPPYSLKLSEYGTASSEKLILNLLLTDITEANRQVQLKLFIENNAGLSIRSNDIVIGAAPIFLDGGVPLRLSNLDLQPYFSLQNLTGIAPQQYSTSLPEGLYRFCFEVYDALSGQQISRKSCVPVYLVLNDPPFLNLPFRGEQVLMREPQNIVFQWTPRHLNATNVSYEFTLTELWDNQMDPQAAFLAGRPLFQTTTFATTLLYGPGETPLLPDKKYGWRVRAIVSDGISETSVFKNDGYSEIYHFTYTGSCEEPEAILAEAKNNTTEKIYWQGVDHKLFDVQYRKKSSDGGIWFNASTLNQNTTIYNLEPGTTYEFRVGGQCIENGPFTYSQIYEFTTTVSTDSDTTYNCGITPEIVITNQEPLQSLVINETFTAGDFPVTVKEITIGNAVYEMSTPPDSTDEEAPLLQENSVQGGTTFSGWGYIVVPYLNDTRIKVSFENIKINTDYQLIEGIVETDYDKNWGGLASVNDILDVFEGNNDLRNINLDYDITIDNISIADDGSIEIAHPVSGAVRREPGGDDVIIMDTNPDGSRDIFHVDADGNIREGGQLAPGGPINSQNTAGVNSKGEVTQLTAQGIKVEFLEYTDYVYGFDRIPSGQEAKLGKYYKQIKDAQGNPYNIINKSVGNGDTDIVRARVTITDSSLTINDLVIKTMHGEKVDYEVSGANEITLNLKGYYTFEHENIYATIQPDKNNDDKQTIAGVFSQWHLANKDVNVTIVPVSGATLPGADVLGSQINTIFKQASVTFNVSIAPELYISKSQIGVGESGALSNYTADQKEIINQFRSRDLVDRKSYYVFVFGNTIRPSRPNVAGFMPLKRQFGFVFLGNLSQQEEGKSSLAGTLAHELGHGAFALQHPFKKLGTTQGGTDWLMDYGNGIRLSHLDWAQIHNPEFRLYLFQDEEDAALTVSALTPSGMKLDYTGDGAIAFTDEIPEYSNGAVFTILENGLLYEWQKYRYKDDGVYVNQGGKLKNAKVSYLSRSDDTPIQLYWHKGSCDQNEIYTSSVRTIYEYILQKDATNPRRVSLDLNNNQNERISLVGKAGCSNDILCGNIAIAELQPEIDELVRISNAINASRSVITAQDLARKVNDISICGLRKLEYSVVKTLLPIIMSQSTFNDSGISEEAIVKLLLCIPVDRYTDFVATLVSNHNQRGLENVIRQMNNSAFQGLSEGGVNSFLATLTQIVVGSENEESIWKVFSSVVRAKYESLQEEPIEGLQLGILQTLSWNNQEELDKIPAVYTLFVDMLKDPNLPLLQEYKIVFDIAKLRYDEKQKFARFTMTDFIMLRMRDMNDNLVEPEVKQLYDLELVPDVSWIFPSVSERFGVLLPKIEIQDLYDNFIWYRNIQNTNSSLQQLNQNPKGFLETFYEQLLIHIEVSNQGNKDFWRTISTITCDNIVDIITHINLNENTSSLQEVAGSIKKQFLRAYFECNYTTSIDNNTQVVEGAERSFMKIFASFSPNDKTILETIENIGFQRIDSKLTNKAFNEFILWIGMQILSSNSGKDIEKIDGVIKLEEEGVVIVDPDPLLQLEADIFQRQNFSGDLIGNEIEIKGNRWPYNQIVPIHVRGSFNFLGKTYKRGDVLIIPIIQAYAMSESNQNIVVWNTLFLTADVISFAAPFVGGSIRLFRVPGHFVSKAIMASDIAASSASALVTALNADAIDPDLRFKIQMASLATSAPSLFNELPNDLDDLLRQANRGIDAARISDSDRAILKSSYGGEAVGGAISSSKIPDELKDAFRRDFGDLNRVDDMNEDFLRGWINFRKNNIDETICR